MNPRTATTAMLLAASMMGMVYDRRDKSLIMNRSGTRARSDRWDLHTPLNTREKQAKNQAARKRKGKR